MVLLSSFFSGHAGSVPNDAKVTVVSPQYRNITENDKLLLVNVSSKIQTEIQTITSYQFVAYDISQIKTLQKKTVK